MKWNKKMKWNKTIQDLIELDKKTPDKCPFCGSFNTKKISAIITGVEFKNQRKCKNCGKKFKIIF
jgi:transposase-like protein